ncbi:PREDICTED: dystonin, partial [Hipposideros armiger]|uniref:Dystonin n=1 Tax=Hipposideros armiger TaxID=186990 RepID=A0A8B7PUN0_HIPAR
MIAAAFLVLLRPYSIQCALFLLLLLLGTIATIVFFCCWHRKLQKGRHPMKSVFSGRSRSRDAVMRSHHFRSEVIYLARTLKGFRASPRHIRRRAAAAAAARLEEAKPVVEVHHQSEQESSARKRRIKKNSRVQPEFYHSIQSAATRRPSSGNASYRCSMSSSADFSDEDDFSQKSGSASPAPGDTLPWNLPKHERSKRKIHGGSVLDPAERAVLRIADERDKVQKKTFTKWINQHLMKVRKHVNDLYEDLRDGHNLISLLEVLSGDTLPREKGRMRFHRLQNVQIALDYLKRRQVKLVNIRNDDITDGNPKLTLGLIWTIILHFQVSPVFLNCHFFYPLLVFSSGSYEGAEKEEQYLDPAKSPLSPEKYSPGRRYFRRKPIKKIVGDTKPAEPNNENEGTERSSIQLSEEQPALLSRGLVREESVSPVLRLGDGMQQGETEVVVDRVKQKLLPSAASASFSHVNVSPAKDSEPQVKVSELDETITEKDSSACCAERKKHSDDVSTREITFQRKTEVFSFRKAASLRSLHWGTERSLEKSGFSEDPLEKHGTGQEKQSIERFCPHAIHSFCSEKKRCHSLCTNVSSTSKDTDGNEFMRLDFSYAVAFGNVAALPDLIDMNTVAVQSNLANLEHAFYVAEKIGVIRLLDPEDVDVSSPDEKSVITYVSSLYDAFPKVPEGGEGIGANALYNQYLQFKETEIPPKETEKSKIKRLYKLLEIWIEFGRIKLLQGYHPNDIEKEWGKLIIAMLEREKALRPELERLEMLQQIANRVQRDSVICEDKLILARNALQSRKWRVAKLRDEIMALRNECSSVYSKGRMLTTEQTKLMISGITQSLNSGFAQTLNPSLNSGLTQSLTPSLTPSSVTSGLSSGLTSRLTPSLTPAYTPAFPGLVPNFNSGVEANSLQTLKLMQIRKPLLKSSLLDQNLTEEEINMKFVQDLLSWVDEMQVQLDRTEWGSDLSSVESHLENHKNVHRAIEEFESSLKEAKISEIQMTAPLKLTYAEKLHRLESQYAKLLNTSRNQERHLDTLHNFVSRATNELIWLNEKEEEEVAYDWSERNTNIARKKDYHAELMRELEQKEENIKSVQEIAEQLLLENHPARLTIEEEKEELLQYKSTVASLMGRAKTVIQLKPRNPECPLKTSIPIKAICDYRQIEITIYKDDECVLANNSHRAKWKVISPTGNEAMVPSVCFTVPPPNKEAVDFANRIEQQYQNVLTLWHETHINMKSVVSWHYLVNEIDRIRASNVASIKTMLPGEHQQVLSNLQSRFEDFLEDSQESQIFSGSDITQLEKEVNVCKQYYQELLKSAEREEQEESVYNLYISEVRNIRLRLENCEDRLIRQIRTPLERDDLHESVFRITEQEKLKKELERLKDDLATITNKCEEFFSQAAASQLRDLEGIGKSLKYYRDTYHPLDDWIQQVEMTQRKIQENQPENSKTLATQLNQQKFFNDAKEATDYLRNLKDAIQRKYSCDRSSSIHKLEDLVQESMFMDLRTRYTALLTLMTQYIKFAGDSLKRLEEEEKSLEEEKKEHVEKAKELQKWVSNISKTLRDGEKAGKSPLSKQKISSEEILTKKEQLSEALQTMQLFLAKHGDKMTDEERNELERQVKALQESSNLFFSESLKQLQESQTIEDAKVEEKLDKVIAGTIDQTTGEVLSVFQAVLRGFVDYDTGIRLLETQLMISGLISPELRKCFDLKSAESHGLIDGQVLCQLEELNQAKEIISAVSSTTIPVLDALAQGTISESMAIRVLEILLSTGFLVIPATGEQLTLQKAFQENLVPSALFSKVLERQNTCKDLIDPCTSEKVSLTDIIQRSILQENTGMRLLPVRPQEAGRITLKCGRNISILRAAHEGLIDRETMFRLLGTQLLSGGLISCNSGQRMTVEEAMAEGVIDRDTANGILTYQVQTGGIIHSNPAKRLTVDEAVQCDLITSSSALLVLEAQRGYVGLIWPHSGEIFPTSSSLQQKLITNELAYKILNGRQKIAALYIPETSQVIGLDVAQQLGIIDNNTASILKSIILPDKMPDLGDLEACKNARRWLSFCKFQPSTVHDYRQEEDDFDGEEPVATQSSEQTKKLFLSYLMINSYMDANTGQRLLLYDGDLNEAVGMLLEGCSAEFDEDTPIKDCIGVLRIPGELLNDTPSKEKDESITSPTVFDTCHCRGPKHKEIPGNRKHALDEELNEMGSNDFRREFYQSGKLANIIATEHKVKISSGVNVPNSISCLTQPGLGEVGMLSQDSENLPKNCENQSQVETNEHADACSHSKNTQNFPSDLITDSIVKSKTSRICDFNETEIEDNINRDSTIFDYSPRLSALLSHDKLKNDQGSFDDVPTMKGNENTCEASALPFNDQTVPLGKKMGEKLQNQFLGIAAINISLQVEHSGQKSLNIGYNDPQGQYHSNKYISDTYGEDEKMNAASQQAPEDKQNESEERSHATAAKGDIDNANASHVCGAPLLEETVSAGDYETSLLDDQQRDTETDTDSEDDFYDTPLFEDDDHDSLLLEGDDCDCLQPEDYDALQEENDGAASPGDVFYDASKGNENSTVTQGVLLDNLSISGKARTPQDVLIAMEKAELGPGERIHLNSVGSYKYNEQLLETVSERESASNLEDDESDSLTDDEIVGRKESFGASLIFDDTGCWRGREEYVTGQEFSSDTDINDSLQNEESYGDFIYDSNDQGDDDGYDDEEEEGVGHENEKPVCQDEADSMDVLLGATTMNEPEAGYENQSINKTVLLDKKHTSSPLEKQQNVNTLQLESSSKSSSVTERNSFPEYTTEVVRKSKENLLNHEMALKDMLLPISKDTESEHNFSPVGILHNTDTTSTSELDSELMNTEVKFIQGPESADFGKGDKYFENVMHQVDLSLDEIVCSEPDLIGRPAEESHLSSVVPVTDKDHQGNGRDLIKKRDDKSNILIEDETSIHKMRSGEGEGLIEGLIEDNKYLKLLPGKSTRESLDLVNSQFPQITNNEEHTQNGSLKKATVTFKDEPKNLQTVVIKSPVQFENLEEIFDSSVSKVIHDITSDVTLSEGNTSTEKEPFTDGPEKKLDLFTCLKDCAKNVTAKDVLKPSEDIPRSILVASPPMKEHLELGVDNAKEKATLTQEGSPVNEMVQQHDLYTKGVSEGGLEFPQFTPERNESTLSILPLRNVEGLGENTDIGQLGLCANGIRSDNSSHTSSTGYSFLEMNKNKEIIEQQPRKEQALSPGFQEKEVQIPELSQVLVEDVKGILNSRLKEGHTNPQEVGEPSACADTKILIQSLIKRVSTSQLVNEASNVPSDSKISDTMGVSHLKNSPELRAEFRDDPLCIANLKPELLLDILKQNQYSPKVIGAFELMKELTQMEYDLEERGIKSKVLPLQLENIFYKLLADGYSEKAELAGDLNQRASPTSEMVDEKPHILDDLKSKEGNHGPLNLQNIKEIGQETSTVCASALPKGEKLEEQCNDFPNYLGCISRSKEMTSGDNSMEQFSSELQQCLQHTSKMQEYLALLQDMKPPIDNPEPLDNNLEALKYQLKQLETFELGLAPIAVILRKDMKLAEEFLKSLPSDFPKGHLEDLSRSHQSLQNAFSSLGNVSSERMKHIMLAIDCEMSKLAVSHEEFLYKLKSFSHWISEKSKSVKDMETANVQDTEYIKKSLEFLKNVLKDLGHTKMQLETTAFDVQFFISEYAQDLSPNQSKQLLRLLNTTQKCFLDVQESVTTQVEHLETQLQLEQDLGDQKMVAERQQEYKQKLQGICDLLTQTENRLIGHQEAFVIGDGTVELKKYQSKQEELQKDMQGSAQALTEIMKTTENFLKENGEKLSQEDKALIEQKLNEAKIKCEQLNLKAEQSKKELDKVMTTAIKEETEKVAAEKQLEESKNKIENLLDWLSNVDKDSERVGLKQTQVIEQNGTHFQEGDGKSAIGEEDEVNGNLLEMDVDGPVGTTEENLNQQYQKVKAQHERITSQHQAVLMATQSAQALLEKQGHYLSPEEKEKLQKNMKELKAHYETALAESEKKMKLTHSLQEELEKFDADYSEFEHWLQQSEQELENLEAGADDLNGLMTKLKRQKSFSEDVISHKGDLRYITISGNRVLEAAKSCSKRDGSGKADQDNIDTSSTHREVQNKLDHATDRFRSLYSKFAISLAPTTVPGPSSVCNDIVGRYDDLSKSVNERNEKLQITLTRSLSVQDGLDEMLDWMGSVESSLKEQGQVPLNSAALQDIISKNIMLEQDIASRQSSINAMNEKVKKFMETTDPSTASSLQAKMKDLSVRFSEAGHKHKEKLTKMEELKTKVELFENLSEKLQTFLETKTQALTEADVPGKDVTELSQYMQESTSEFLEHKKDLEVLQSLLKEISSHGLPGDKALVFEKTNNLSKKFKEMEDTITEKKEAVSSCQEQMDAFQVLVKSLKSWIKETTERVPIVQPSFGAEDLGKSLEETKKLQEQWSLKTPEIQKVNNSGISLCNLISAVTTPAKAIAAVKSGGVILNGEGTMTDTQEILASKGLTSIKKDMTDISHGYEDLGLLLKDKIAELNTKLTKLQKAQEESSAMMQWLQTMNKTATKWHQAPTPTDTEAVKTQVEQNKSFEAELKQNVNKVQELKDKLTELLEQNPDTPEAPKWKQMLMEIDSKWQELNQLTVDRQQKLEESSNNLTQFQTVEAQLKQWLVEKELMVSVLGPLSIDPNMLNTQRQQVQILLQEFDTRKPQYEQLTAAGQGILSRPGEHPSFHGLVKEQLAAVTQKWDSLTGQLSDRCDWIDQAIVKSTQYQSLLRSLSDKLSDLDNKLSSSVAVSTQPDAMNQQLETAQKMKQEIEQEMEQIKVAQTLCEDLSALVKEEYLKAELSRQLEGILKSFKDIQQKAENHVQHLQSACASSHQFQQMSRDFQAWLDTKKEELNKSHPISAKLDVLESLIKYQTDFSKTLTAQASVYEKTIAEGENLLLKTQGSEKAALQSQLNTIKTNWDGFNKQVKEREDKVKDSLEKALKYKEHVETLRPWIDKCQNNVEEIKFCLDPAETEKSIAKFKSLQKEIDQRFGMVELLNNAANSLLSVCEIDKEVVTDEAKSLNQKVDMVTEQLHSKKLSLESMAQKLKEFQEVSKETKRQLQCAKEQLDVHDSLGPQAYSNKYLTMLQTQQKSLQTLKQQVDLAKGLAQDLVADASDSKGTSDVLLQAEALAQEHSALSQQVDEKCSFLETKLQGIGHFQNTIREMFSQFAEFDDELDSMAPVGRDVETLQHQKEAITAFLKKLEAFIASNDNANKTCKMMLATEETSPDLVGIKRDLEALSKQCNKLLDRAQAREEQVEGTIERLGEFYSKLKEFSTLLQKAEEHEEAQGPVAMETETINQQLNVFKVFQKEEIEPLQVKQQDVNWLGQGLIQSAAKSTNTEGLEHDLDDVNARWKTLNKKVAQRAAQLQEALLHCGRFQDALESLLSWMQDTEELVANQKPPSAEFKVVKAQIQEQKLLQRLLDDRKSTVEVIKREGEKIAATAEPADKVKILKQLSLLDSRWEALLNKAEMRNRQLEGISVVAQQFHETLEPLNEWLTTIEKRLANCEPIGTQASKLEEQIAQHKALEDDIINHNKLLHQAVSIGQSLKVLSSREDKDMVQSKLDSSQVWYIEIQEKSHSRSELLQQALCNAKIFGEDEVELMNWLNEVHGKLSTLSVHDYSTEGLWEQQSELRVLQEDILLRKQSVDQALLNGLELLKQTTGDEVLIIQDKLEAIKARYKDITKLSTDVAKTLEQALQLAQRLHSTHEELCTWLDTVEVELLSYETQVLKGEAASQAHVRQKELKKEAKNNKALLDCLNEVSSALLELVPWRAREGLEKMVAEDNERYRLVNDTITQKVEEIDAAILRSQQFDQAADAELSWITETEKKLMSLGDIRLEQDQTSAQLQVQKTFTMEILRHKDIIDELVKSGHKIMTTFSEEEKQSMKKKLDKVLKNYDTICQINSERYLQLERAQSLVNQFWETYEELWPWLTETQRIISQLPAPALEYETLRQQQEAHRQLRELIAEHKPHIDKMNKTGPQLLELSPEEGFSIQEKYVAADTLYSQIKEDVKKRAVALDEAISQSTQVIAIFDWVDIAGGKLASMSPIGTDLETVKQQIEELK